MQSDAPSDLAAGLTYVSDEQPGLHRRKSGGGFSYFDTKERSVRDPETLARIKSLAIPPAWSDVWICARASGHIQATGRDAKGRKQYRYHPSWRETQDRTKYQRLIAFGEALPRIRERVDHDLSLAGPQRDRVLAALVSLLDSTLIRVGNRQYERQNGSFGLTTLRNRHVKLQGASLRFDFKGKSGKRHSITIRNRRLARIVGQCLEIPGQELFQYLDDAGERHSVTSGDINDYLREAGGEDLTAKDYRTWNGTLLAATALEQAPPPETQTEAKHAVVAAVEVVAEQLGNTPAVCRKSYIDPRVIEQYEEGKLADTLKRCRARRRVRSGLSDDEAAVLAMLKTLQKHSSASSRKKS